MASGHDFNFAGGGLLARMGATWFVSYAYYCNIDNTHRNWDRVSTAVNRMSVYASSANYHKFWLTEVLKMDDKRLNTNTIGLKASETKKMAEKILSVM